MHLQLRSVLMPVASGPPSPPCVHSEHQRGEESMESGFSEGNASVKGQECRFLRRELSTPISSALAHVNL